MGSRVDMATDFGLYIDLASDLSHYIIVPALVCPVFILFLTILYHARYDFLGYISFRLLTR